MMRPRRYFGYDVAAFRVHLLRLCGIAGYAGMLYTFVMEFASPTFLAVPISLSIIIWCAVGGRAACQARSSARCWSPACREPLGNPGIP